MRESRWVWTLEATAARRQVARNRGGHRAESLAGGCVGKQAAAVGAHAGGGRDGRSGGARLEI